MLCSRNKTLGVCFGHQLLAVALGGIVERSEKGWGAGVMPANVVHKVPWMKNHLNDGYDILYSHQDQVTRLPIDATLIATSEFCPNNTYCIHDIVFSMQGHPEFTRDYAKSRYDTRVDKLGQKTYDDAINSLDKKTDEMIVGDWIKEFFEG